MRERIPAIVLGGTGYVAGELVRLLASHPRLDLAAVASDSQPDTPVAQFFPHLQPVLPHLPGSIHAFALTQRGHGDADRPGSGYRTRDFAADVAAFMDALGLGQAIVVGPSMGGTNAKRFGLDPGVVTQLFDLMTGHAGDSRAAFAALRRFERPNPTFTAGLDELQQEAAGCTRCMLAEGRTQVVFGVGDPNADRILAGNSTLSARLGLRGGAVEIDSATLANPQGKLRPGMFVQTELALGASRPVVALPASSISYAPYGDSVFVVADLKDQKGQTYRGVRQQFVKVEGGRGDQVAVVSGLKPGDEVVTSGVFKLRNGAAVLVNNKVRPANNPAAKPEDS